MDDQDFSLSATKLIQSWMLLAKAQEADSSLDGQGLSSLAKKLVQSGTVLPHVEVEKRDDGYFRPNRLFC